MTKKNIASRSTILGLFATALIMPALATAGPGKPGINSVVPGGNIVDIALAVNAGGEFDYLLGAVGCLTDSEGNNPVIALLSGDDKYTLFAPTDDAFIALQTALEIEVPSPEATCALGPEAVFNVLAYHVTDGRRFANSVFNKKNTKMIEMLNGGYVISNPDGTLNDNNAQTVSIVAPLFDINASNGVIHVIDTVLLP